MPPVVRPRILIVEDETIVARDIQTQLQGLGFLLDIGCDAFQGYYFGKPLPASQLHD